MKSLIGAVAVSFSAIFAAQAKALPVEKDDLEISFIKLDRYGAARHRP
jgi:hypothetical protein